MNLPTKAFYSSSTNQKNDNPLLKFVAVSLFALGIGIMLFEALVAHHNANFVPPCPGAFCLYYPDETHFYFGLFPAIAGTIMIAINKTRNQLRKTDSLNH
jgi:hypothetical protein